MMPTFALPRPVAPKVQESLVGFLMRSAEMNHFPSTWMLQTLLGHRRHPPTIREAMQLAALCGCAPGEVTQLFGFRVRRPDGVRAWRLGMEWITCAHFVSCRAMALCADCLQEALYLRGVWELTLYRCCPYHHTQLLRACPRCHKPLQWTRPRLWQCPCGFDYRHAETLAPNAAALATAQIIETRLDATQAFPPPPDVPAHIVERLGQLALDSQCKTLWFLGHMVGGVETRALRPRVKQRRANYVDALIESAFDVLRDWPGSLWRHFASRAENARESAGMVRIGPVFQPLAAYLAEQLREPDLAFLRRAYEQQLRVVWETLGRELPNSLGSQLEFTFSDDAGNR